MDGATTDCGAFDETVVFLSHFNDLHDPRQQAKVTYPLDEVLLLCLLGVLAGAEAFTEIALFGVKKLGFQAQTRGIFRSTQNQYVMRQCGWHADLLMSAGCGCA
jgi:hypothetical protein